LVFASWCVSASITSPDALPGITSSRQRASLPAGGSITSDLDATNPQPLTTVSRKSRFLTGALQDDKTSSSLSDYFNLLALFLWFLPPGA